MRKTSRMEYALNEQQPHICKEHVKDPWWQVARCAPTNSLQATNVKRHPVYSQKEMSHAHYVLQRGASGRNAPLAWICKPRDTCTEQDRDVPITTQ